MTDKQYGQWLAMIFSAYPGGLGVWGVLAGLQQGRVGPIILGCVFLVVAYYIYRAIAQAAEKKS